MRVLYSVKSKLHNPLYEINNGEKVPYPENARRVEVILDELLKKGFQAEKIEAGIPISHLTKVHSKDFVQFIKNASKSLKKNEHLFPDVFPEKATKKFTNALALMGQFSFDTYTPIVNGTYKASMSAAALAFKGAKEIASKNAKSIYILAHPLGHHSQSSKMGGYSYFNNAAIAAQYLSDFGSVAILDLDFHHGNGTQEIFYERNDILYISIHADPNSKFPYYFGFKDEKGIGKGLNYTINYPLPMGTDNTTYQKILKKAVASIKDFGPKFLVISLGFDTYKDDPIGGFKLTTGYYWKMAETINQLGLPTVIIQEGGYDLSALGKNVASFLKGFQTLYD